jgi:peptidoglycan hydrolase CwlO-like protein
MSKMSGRQEPVHMLARLPSADSDKIPSAEPENHLGVIEPGHPSFVSPEMSWDGVPHVSDFSEGDAGNGAEAIARDNSDPPPIRELSTPMPPRNESAQDIETAQAPANSPKSNILTIEHTINATPSSSRSASFLFGMSKPVFIAVAAVALLLMSTWAYFFSQFLRIPGLDDQITELTSQVDRLEVEVEELEGEIDRLTVQVDRLNSTVDDLKVEIDTLQKLNDQLKAENEVFSELNDLLNASNADLETFVKLLNETSPELAGQVDKLMDENSELRNLTSELKATEVNLRGEVTTLQNTTDALNETNIALQNQIDGLFEQVEEMNVTNAALQQENQNLTSQVERLDIKNGDLQNEVDKLESISRYLQEFVQNNETLADIVEQLNSLIEANRNLALTSLQNQYLSRIDFWLCDFLTDFAGLAFIEDPELPLGDDDYPDVIGHVERQLLSDLCLQTTNFEDFMKVLFLNETTGPPPPVNVTTNQFRSAVAQYTTLALDYYFPDSGEPGLTDLDWDLAGYQCTGLPTDLSFVISFDA